MVRVVFFAGVREQLDCEGLEIPWQPGLDTLRGLEQWLIDTRGPDWARVLGQDNLIRALNHRVSDPDAIVNDGDEVAFYPPVTGG